MSLLQLCLAFSLFLILIWWCYCYGTQHKNKGHPVWHVIGYLLSRLINRQHIYDWITDVIIRNGGTVTLQGPLKTRILTAHAANIEYVVKTKYHNFGKGNSYKDIFRDFFGSPFTDDGKRFQEEHKLIEMLFTSAGFLNTAREVLPLTVHQKLLPVLSRAAVSGASIDLQDVLHRLALDIICVLGFGVDPGSLSSELPRVPFLESFDEAVETLMHRFFMPAFFWKTMRFLNLGPERRFHRARQVVYEYVDKVLFRPDVSFDGGEHWNIESACRRLGLNSSEENPRKFRLSLILAGMDTVSVGLTWFFWLVAQHPQIEASILTEIRHILSQRTTSGVQDTESDMEPDPFSFEEVKQMHYLHAALSESLRIYPPVPLEIVEAFEDDVLPDGTSVGKGVQLFYSIYSLGRLENVWGQDCREFKPERWLKNGRFVRASEFKFAAFNGGPRRCTGREFAYWQMKWVASSVLLRYGLKIASKHIGVARLTMTLSMKNGLPVTIYPRHEG